MNFEDSAAGPAAGHLHSWQLIGGLAVAAALLMLLRLGAADVCSYNEAVEGLVVQQMVEHHVVMLPRSIGAPMYKPPLFHWTALALDRGLGMRKVTAFNLRLPSALYGVLGVIMVVAFAYSWLSPPAALIAGLVLLGSYQYVSQARFGRVDMTLAAMETAALLCFPYWLRHTRESDPARARVWHYLMAMAVGLGVLAKGPVGALLPLSAMVAFLMLGREWRTTARLFAPRPVLLAAAVGSSWYIACYLAGRRDFLTLQLETENFGRFFGTLGFMPPWYYLVPLLFNSGPLSLLALIAVGAALLSGWRSWPYDQARNRPSDTPFELARFLAGFWLITVLFFTLAAYKRRSYLLPLWPASALLIAWWVENWIPPARKLMVRRAVASVCVALAVFNLAYIPHKEAATCNNDSYRPAAAATNRVVGPDEPLFLYGMTEEPAAMRFYLDRPVTILAGQLGDAPPGYIMVPAQVWLAQREHAPGLEAVLETPPGGPPFVLLRHGKTYAAAQAERRF